MGADSTDVPASDRPSSHAGSDPPGERDRDLALRAEDALVIDRAPHITSGFDGKINLCSGAVHADGGLDYVSHYTGGVYDFAVDKLKHSASHAADPLDLRRRLYRSIGRQLGFKIETLDRILEDARTGRIIRTVFQTEHGAVYSNFVKPGEYIVALRFFAGALAPPSGLLPQLQAADEADKRAAKLVTDLRRHVSLGPENPGGWLTQRPAGPSSSTSADNATADRIHWNGHRAGPLADHCINALDPEELAYLAHYGDDTEIFSIDFFNDPAIGRYFTHITPVARRNLYHKVGRHFRLLSGQLSQLVRPLFGGRLTRVVLDVEQGALYYYRLRPGRYLVGVTLNQDRVSQGDWRIAQLVARLAT